MASTEDYIRVHASGEASKRNPLPPPRPIPAFLGVDSLANRASKAVLSYGFNVLDPGRKWLWAGKKG